MTAADHAGHEPTTHAQTSSVTIAMRLAGSTG